MISDILFLVLFLVMVLFGWKTGAVTQLVRLGAAVAAITFAPVAAKPVQDVLFDDLIDPAYFEHVISYVLALVAIYIFISIAGWIFVRIVRLSSSALSFVDRAAGSVLAGVKALLVIYVLVIALVMFQDPLAGHDPDNSLGLQHGLLTEFAQTHDMLAPWQFQDLETLHRCLELAHHVKQSGQVAKPSQYLSFDALMENPLFHDIFSDRHVIDAVTEDNYSFTILDRRIRALLHERRFVHQLHAAQCKDILNDDRNDPNSAPRKVKTSLAPGVLGV